MQLQFIDERAVGPKERRLIRSHVMRGRNAGRPRPSRRKQNDAVDVKRRPRVLERQELEHHSASCVPVDHTRNLRLNRVFCNDLTPLPFPEQMDLKSQNLIHQCKNAAHKFFGCHKSSNNPIGFTALVETVYPPRFCSKLDVTNYIWFQYALLDKACQYTTLGRRSQC